MREVKAYAAVGRIGRVMAARLLPGQDVVEQWQDIEALKVHTESEHFQTFVRVIRKSS